MVNPLYAVFAQFAGVRVSQGISAPGQRLAFARGLLQVFSSLATATGVASFLTLATHTEGALSWSWPLWYGCAAAVLLFDAAFNIVLNLASGLPFVVLIAVRIGLTLMVAQFAAQNLTMLFSQHGLRPIAEALATKEFDASLSTLKAERDSADGALIAARKALSDFEREVNTQIKTVDMPAMCATAGNTASDDPATQARLQRAERMRLDRCNRLFAQNMTAESKRQGGQDTLRASLQEAVSKAENRANEARNGYKSKDDGRSRSVAELAANVSIQASALESLSEKSAGTRWLHRGLLIALAVVELLSAAIKVFTSHIDESALSDRDAIESAAANRSDGLYFTKLMRQARASTPAAAVVREAQQSFTDQARGALAASNAERVAQHRHRQLRGQLGGLAVGDG